jgi:hypothetical protein
MSDQIDRRPGGGGAKAQNTKYKDWGGDGSYPEAVAAFLYAWDTLAGSEAKLLVDSNGYLQVTTKPSVALQNAVIDTASSGDNTIVAADATKKIKVVSYSIVVSAAVSVRWKSGATSKSGAMAFAANGGIALAGNVNAPLFETAVNNALVLNLGSANQASGHVAYFLEA